MPGAASKAQTSPVSKENKKETGKKDIKKAVKLQNNTIVKKETVTQKISKESPKKTVKENKPQVLNVEVQTEEPQEVIQEEIVQENLPQEQVNSEAQNEITAQDNDLEENYLEEKSDIQKYEDLISKKIISFIRKVENKTGIEISLNKSLFKKALKCTIMAAFVILAIMLFLASVFAIISNKKRRNNRINETLGLSGFRNNSEVKDEPQKKDNNGQYFVFDKNIFQDFYNPNAQSGRKHYELSSYDPDIQVNYGKGNISAKQNKKYTSKTHKDENEYDIIQKILKEDSLIEFEPDELRKIEYAPVSQTVKKPKKETVKKAPKKEAPSQPVVLSSVEIAPERGFMCVSYNDNINLLGYIFDDVYALYDFKQPKLENYDIKFRLSDKDDKGANFIVRVNDIKMLVRVTKSFMTLEVLM